MDFFSSKIFVMLTKLMSLLLLRILVTMVTSSENTMVTLDVAWEDIGNIVGRRVLSGRYLLFLADVVLLKEGAGHFHLHLMASSEERAE